MTYSAAALKPAQSNSYGNPSAAVKTPRHAEYQAFARATAQLAAISRKAAQDDPPSVSEIAKALTDNQRLWLTIAADVAGDGNELPRDLRARLFYLNEFTQAHSRKVLDGKAAIDALVEINTAVMRGLRAELPQAEAQ